MPLSLLHPALFALGIACVSIPIIIHLLKRRRRVISWGAMRFLEDAYRKRRRIITIEQLLLLSLRCLLIALIALGVGSLILGSGMRDRQSRTLVIVLDDSIASARRLGDSSVLEATKQSIVEHLETLDPMRGDRVALISAASPARAIVMPATDDFGAVLPLIKQVRTTDAGYDAAGVAELLGGLGADEERTSRRVLLLAGDGRGMGNAMRSLDEEPTRSAFDELLLTRPDDTKARNTGIARAVPARALVVRDGVSLPQSLRVDLIRSGVVDDAAVSSVEVVDEAGRTRGQAEHAWRPGQRQATITLPVETDGLEAGPSGSAVLRVRLGADDNLRDNEVFVAFPVLGSLRVAVIDRPSGNALGQSARIAPSRWVRAALAPRDDAGVRITSIDASRAASRLATRVDAVFVLAPASLDDEAWERLARLREQGVMLVVTPDAERESLAWFDKLRALAPGAFEGVEGVEPHEPPLAVSDAIDEASLLAGIAGEWPDLSASVRVARSLRIPSSATPIARLSDGTPLGVQISASEDGGGVLVVLALPIDLAWSDLPARPLFVAMMQELLRQGVGAGVTIPPVVAGSIPTDPLWVRSAAPVMPDPGARDDLHDLNQHAGVLALRDAEGSTRALRLITPDAQAALADGVDPDELQQRVERLVDAPTVAWLGGEANTEETPGVVSSTDPRSLALWMLWAALGVAIIEFVLARFFTARMLAGERVMGADAGRGARA